VGAQDDASAAVPMGALRGLLYVSKMSSPRRRSPGHRFDKA